MSPLKIEKRSKEDGSGDYFTLDGGDHIGDGQMVMLDPFFEAWGYLRGGRCRYREEEAGPLLSREIFPGDSFTVELPDRIIRVLGI